MNGVSKFEDRAPGYEGETAKQLWRDERWPSNRGGLCPGAIKPAQGPQSAWPEHRETRSPSPPQELHLLLLREKFKTRIEQSPVSTQPRLSEQEALQRAQPLFCTKSGQEARAGTWFEASNTGTNAGGLRQAAETVNFITPLAPERPDPALPRAGDAEIDGTTPVLPR